MRNDAFPQPLLSPTGTLKSLLRTLEGLARTLCLTTPKQQEAVECRTLMLGATRVCVGLGQGMEDSLTLFAFPKLSEGSS